MKDDQFRRAAAEEIAKQRTNLGISQQEIFDETGIHIGRIECMGRPMNLFCYYRICKYLDIPFQTILDRIVSYENNLLQ